MHSYGNGLLRALPSVSSPSPELLSYPACCSSLALDWGTGHQPWCLVSCRCGRPCTLLCTHTRVTLGHTPHPKASARVYVGVHLPPEKSTNRLVLPQTPFNGFSVDLTSSAIVLHCTSSAFLVIDSLTDII